MPKGGAGCGRDDLPLGEDVNGLRFGRLAKDALRMEKTIPLKKPFIKGFRFALTDWEREDYSSNVTGGFALMLTVPEVK
jgi:hypothetical protein